MTSRIQAARGAVEVIVVGGGPAGWAVADACAREGLDTVLVNPDPFARWPATYGLWEDQVPEGVQAMRATALATGRALSRGYAVLDNDSALAVFSGGGVRAVAGSVVAAEFGSRGATVVLTSGVRLACAVVIDASGVRRVLSGGPPRGTRVEQTAFGVVVPADTPLVTPGAAVFMDGWSTLDDEPTFLYAV
ncbi:MAG: lycopene cyclase family protein, partial [Actinomycetota bacterium]|nr:lycopene cyclase family protein [Actinomycetota bacterium]